MEARARPQPGDIYLVPDERGRWAFVLRFVRLHDGDPAVGVFRDDAGDLYVCGFHELQSARLADTGDSVEPVERDEARRYRRRSRVTAQQRANRKLTDKQRAALFALAHRRGLEIDDLRAMTPQGSISKLTMREAGDLIDRLKGGRAVGT